MRQFGIWLMCAALASAAQSSVPGTAEQVAVVGDGIVNAAKLKPYDTAFAVTYDVANGEKISTGIWTDQLRLRDVDGRKAWVRIQSMATFNGLVLTSVNTFDPVTFAPIGTILKGRDGAREYWTFANTIAKGRIVGPDAHETVKTVTSTRPAFDFNCCMASLVPAALPLAVGKTFVLPGVPAKDGNPDMYRFHVRGRERIRAGYLGLVDTWVVDFHQPGSGTVTFWITDNPRRAVRERLVGFPNAKTCTAPPTAAAAACQAQTTTAGLHFDQTFEMLGSR